MDSLKIISDINTKINALDEKLAKTSKSAGVAFSYLYSRIGEIENNSDVIKTINDRVSDISYTVEGAKLSSYSYIVSLKGNITDINSDICKISLKNSEEVISLENELKDIKEKLAEFEKKIDDIIECPEKYIMVKKEPPLYIKLIQGIGNFIYKLFHIRKIQKEREALIEAERKRAEEEKRRKEEAEKQRKIREQQEKAEKLNTIKNLIK